MSQSVWLSLWVYSHPVAQWTQEGIIWSIKGHLSLCCHWCLYSSFISQFGKPAEQHTKLMPTRCVFTPAPCCICLSQWFTSSCFAVCVFGWVLPQWEEQFGSTEEDRLVTVSCSWRRRLVLWHHNTTSVVCRLDTSFTLFATGAACVLPQSTNWMWKACGPWWYEGQHTQCGGSFKKSLCVLFMWL